MTTVMLLIYLADVCGDVNRFGFAGLVAVGALLVGLGVFSLFSIGDPIGGCPTCIKPMFKVGVITAGVFALLVTVTPSERTVYAMAGAGYAQVLVQSDVFDHAGERAEELLDSINYFLRHGAADSQDIIEKIKEIKELKEK